MSSSRRSSGYGYESGGELPRQPADRQSSHYQGAGMAERGEQPYTEELQSLRENHQLGQMSNRHVDQNRGPNIQLAQAYHLGRDGGEYESDIAVRTSPELFYDSAGRPQFDNIPNPRQHEHPSHNPNGVFLERQNLQHPNTVGGISLYNDSLSPSCSLSPSSVPPGGHESYRRNGKHQKEESSSAPQTSKFKTNAKMFFKEVGHIKETIVDGTNNLFAKWAGVVYRRPYIVIGTSLLISIICSIGLFPGMTIWIDGAENLYSLPFSSARDHQASHKFFFGESTTRTNIVIVTKDMRGDETDSNVLTWRLLDGLKRVDNLVEGKDIDSAGRLIRIPSDTVPGKYLVFEDLCARDPWQQCLSRSVLGAGIEDWNAIMDKSREDSPPEFMVFNGLLVNPINSQFFVPEYFLGGVDTHDCVRDIPAEAADMLVDDANIIGSPSAGVKRCNIQCITRAEAFLMTYDSSDKPEVLSKNFAWEEVLINTLIANEHMEGLRTSIMAFRSRDDELQASTAESNDVVFVVLTFVILVAYSSALNFSCDLYRSKSYAALAGAGAASLGLLSGMGFVSMCQVAMVPTVLVCPFLVMGIGVDDMFVIINSYSLSYMVQSAEERCVVSLKDSGLSITITTTTNLIAFAVGAFSPYLSIKNFCIYSACSLAMGYIFVLTFFFAFLCLDAKREEASKVCLFCLPKKTEKQHRLENERAAMTLEEQRRHGNLQQISTFSLVTYKVQVNATERAQKSSVSGANYGSNDLRSSKMAISEVDRGSSSPERRNVLSRFRNIVGKSNNKSKKTNPEGLSEEDEISSQYIDGVDKKQIKTSSSLAGHALSAFDPTLVRQAVYDEPKGNVGRLWRLFFLQHYGPFLMRPYVKIAVMVIFSTFFGVSVYGFTNLKQGLNLAELSPPDSYLQKFDSNLEKYFTKFDTATDIFFPEYVEWWEVDVQRTLRQLHAQLDSRESTVIVVSPLLQMLDDPALMGRLTSGNKEVFETTLYNTLKDESSFYKQFEFDFFWEGKELYTWRFKVLPKYMATSEERATWMEEIRADAVSQEKAEPPLTAIPYTYMMIFYESDLEILSSVLINMIVAAVAMLLVAFLLIPQLVAGLLVIGIMILIDVGLFGFMYYWDVKLNMVSMINLVISIGFAVDYSAHMCHTFTHCEGGSRDLRAIETLVLMGTPVMHGAASTLLGVLMLGFSTSYVFTVFFKMMVMVIVFGSTHGLVLLPVLLSYIGEMGGHGHDTEHQEEIQWQSNYGEQELRDASTADDMKSALDSRVCDDMTFEVVPRDRMDPDRMWYDSVGLPPNYSSQQSNPRMTESLTAGFNCAGHDGLIRRELQATSPRSLYISNQANLTEVLPDQRGSSRPHMPLDSARQSGDSEILPKVGRHSVTEYAANMHPEGGAGTRANPRPNNPPQNAPQETRQQIALYTTTIEARANTFYPNYSQQKQTERSYADLAAVPPTLAVPQGDPQGRRAYDQHGQRRRADSGDPSTGFNVAERRNPAPRVYGSTDTKDTRRP